MVAEAGEIGTSAACVISAGFAEVGAEGASLQRALVAEAEAKGVRLVGPNCTGIFTTTAGVRFNATFSRTVPPPGRTSLLSQSGAFGVAVLEAAEARGIGIGAFVSVGNSADVTCNDLLEYWGEDPDTDLILLYLESIPDPARFVRICRKLTSSVPVVAVKAGRTKAGRRGASSHTAALSGGDVAVEALLRQAGVIRAASIRGDAGPRHRAGRATAFQGTAGGHRDQRRRPGRACGRRLREQRPRRARVEPGDRRQAAPVAPGPGERAQPRRHDRERHRLTVRRGRAACWVPRPRSTA